MNTNTQTIRDILFESDKLNKYKEDSEILINDKILFYILYISYKNQSFTLNAEVQEEREDLSAFIDDTKYLPNYINAVTDFIEEKIEDVRRAKCIEQKYL